LKRQVEGLEKALRQTRKSADTKVDVPASGVSLLSLAARQGA